MTSQNMVLMVRSWNLTHLRYMQIRGFTLQHLCAKHRLSLNMSRWSWPLFRPQTTWTILVWVEGS